MNVPNFKSEEEAQWWYANRETVGKEFSQAMSEGRTSRGLGSSIQESVEALKSKPIHIRIPNSDLALARELAQKTGMPYQTYLKVTAA